jgi:hypothetical protein
MQRPPAEQITLCIVGSRELSWREPTKAVVRSIIRATLTLIDPDAVISGQSPAGGVDVWAEQEAKRMGFPFMPFPPRAHNRAAYFERDIAMAEACTHLLCLESRLSMTHGARFTHDRAKQRGRVAGLIVI